MLERYEGVVDMQLLRKIGASEFRRRDTGQHCLLLALKLFTLVWVEEEGVGSEVMRVQVGDVRERWCIEVVVKRLTDLGGAISCRGVVVHTSTKPESGRTRRWVGITKLVHVLVRIVGTSCLCQKRRRSTAGRSRRAHVSVMRQACSGCRLMWVERAVDRIDVIVGGVHVGRGWSVLCEAGWCKLFAGATVR